MTSEPRLRKLDRLAEGEYRLFLCGRENPIVCRVLPADPPLEPVALWIDRDAWQRVGEVEFDGDGGALDTAGMRRAVLSFHHCGFAPWAGPEVGPSSPAWLRIENLRLSAISYLDDGWFACCFSDKSGGSPEVLVYRFDPELSVLGASEIQELVYHQGTMPAVCAFREACLFGRCDVRFGAGEGR